MVRKSWYAESIKSVRFSIFYTWEGTMSRKTIVIAEIGENHHGAWDIAAEMVRQAALNGADIVKFQSYLGSQFLPDDPEYDWFQRVALPDDKHFEFKKLAEDSGIEFMSAPFSAERARFLCETLGVRSVKIASGVMTNRGMLDVVNANASTVKRVYLSTGMAIIEEVKASLARLNKIEEVFILQCVAQYPALPHQASLAAIQTLAREFPGHRVGYSDHTVGLTACMAAVALGATVLEKHFTFSKLLPGTDHAGSMTPDELAILSSQVEALEQMLGTGEKVPTPEEEAVRGLIRERFCT
jgi:sialic acid synthase SpsE